jgi:hypothetical protein
MKLELLQRSRLWLFGNRGDSGDGGEGEVTGDGGGEESEWELQGGARGLWRFVGWFDFGFRGLSCERGGVLRVTSHERHSRFAMSSLACACEMVQVRARVRDASFQEAASGVDQRFPDSLGSVLSPVAFPPRSISRDSDARVGANIDGLNSAAL